MTALIEYLTVLLEYIDLLGPISRVGPRAKCPSCPPPPPSAALVFVYSVNATNVYTELAIYEVALCLKPGSSPISISPIHKGSSCDDPGNFRPISVVQIIAKGS